MTQVANKRIGVLFGMEDTFPWALASRSCHEVPFYRGGVAEGERPPAVMQVSAQDGTRGRLFEIGTDNATVRITTSDCPVSIVSANRS